MCACSWLYVMQFKGQKRVQWARSVVGLINMGMEYGNYGNYRNYGTRRVVGVMKWDVVGEDGSDE